MGYIKQQLEKKLGASEKRIMLKTVSSDTYPRDYWPGRIVNGFKADTRRIIYYSEGWDFCQLIDICRAKNSIMVNKESRYEDWFDGEIKIVDGYLH